jgi:hypothetical protein
VSSRTYYIAANSSRPADVRLKMLEVEALGYVRLVDWTAALGAPLSDYPRLAEEDVAAARDSDLFVLLAEPMSYGAMVELGARISAGKRAHVVASVPFHFFGFHPLVAKHASWESFLDAATRETSGSL